MIYLQQKNEFIANGIDDKTLRQQLKMQGIDARRLSRFTQLVLLGALPFKDHIRPDCGIYLGSPFNSPSKFDKMFHQLNEQNVPSPLDFMANINNAATFQLSQCLQTTGNSIFLAIDRTTIWQPFEMAKLDLICGDVEQALVGWALEAYQTTQTEGAIFWLLGKNEEKANEREKNAGEKLTTFSAPDETADFLTFLTSSPP